MGILKTAVRASVATRVAGNVHRKQQNRWAAEDAAKAAQAQAQAPVPVQPVVVAAPPAPAAPAAPQPSAMDQLRQLGELKAAGVLSDAEFEAAKAPLVARMAAGM